MAVIRGNRISHKNAYNGLSEARARGGAVSAERRDSFLAILLRVLVSIIGIGLLVNAVSDKISLPLWLSGLLLTLTAALGISLEWRMSNRTSRLSRQRPTALPVSPPRNFVDPGELVPQVRELLSPTGSESPTVGLWGMSGIGKTTLAAQVAFAPDVFPGGVFWASLQTENEATIFLRAWLVQCQVTPEGALPELIALTKQTLQSLAAERGRVVVVLDDVSRSSIRAALLLSEVRVPGVSMVVTTQNREIAVDFGDTSLRVPLLSDQKARDLFTKISPGSWDDALDRILDMLEGHPLAVTIAAKQVARALNRGAAATSLARELAAVGRTVALPGTDTVPGLASVVRVAYDRLGGPARRVFLAACALAEGSFTAQDVARLLRIAPAGSRERTGRRRKRGTATLSGLWASVSDQAVGRCAAELDMLAQLSMVSVEDAGYALHPVLRDFGRLQGSGSKMLRAAFRELFTEYARQSAGETPEAFDALDQQRRNLVSATAEAHEDGYWRPTIGLTRVLYSPNYPYLKVRGLLGEARKILELGADAARHAGDDIATAEFSGNLGTVLEEAGRLQEALAAYRGVARLYEKIGWTGQVALAHVREAGVLEQQGHTAEAIQTYRTALELEPTGEPILSDLIEESRAPASVRFPARDPHNVGWRATAYESMGRLSEIQGDQAAARLEFEKAAAWAATEGRYTQLLDCVADLARVVVDTGDPSFAAELYGYAQREFERLTYHDDRSAGAQSIALIAANLGRVDEAERWYRRGLEEVSDTKVRERKSAAAVLALFLAQRGRPGDRDEVEYLVAEARDARDVPPSRQATDNARTALLIVLDSRGEWDVMAQELRRAADARRLEGAWPELIDLLGKQGDLEQRQGRHESAARLSDEALRLARELGDRHLLSVTLANRAMRAINMSDPVAAERLLAELPTPLPSALQFHVNVVATVLAVQRGRMKQAAAIAGLIREAAAASGPPEEVNAGQYSMAWNALEMVARLSGDQAAAQDYLNRWRALHQDAAEPPEWLTEAASLAWSGGDMTTAQDALDRVLARPDTDGQTRLVAQLMSCRRQVSTGPWDGLVEAHEAMLALAGVTSNPDLLIQARLGLGALALAARNPDGALRHLTWCRSRAEAAGLELRVLEVDLFLAAAYQQAGDVAAGRRHAVLLLGALQRFGRQSCWLPLAHIGLARQGLLEQRLGLAGAHLGTARRLLSSQPNDWHRAHLLDIEGQLALRLGEAAQAETCYQESLDIRLRFGLVPEQAESVLRLAGAAASRGDRWAATERYQRAAQLVETLGEPARRWHEEIRAHYA